MMTVLHKVLQDTRNPDNPEQCALCGGPVRPIICQCTKAYSVYVFECKQCGGISTLLTETYAEDDTLKTAKA